MLDFDQLLNRECRLAALALCLEIARARQRREGHTCPEYVLPSAHRASSWLDRKSTRLNSSHVAISYAVFCLKKKKTLSGRMLQRPPGRIMQNIYFKRLYSLIH